MKNFTYRSIEERENLEAILRRRRRKVNRQQLIAGLILAVIVTVVCLYVGRKVWYTEFDGYIHADVNRIRAPYDMFVDSIYVAPGNTIHKGDTLFSYHVLDWLVMDANPNDEPELDSRRRNLMLQYTTASQQAGVLDVRIAELRKQIDVESHNILFGLSDNAHKMDLERALTEAEAQKRGLRNQMGVIARMMRETGAGTGVGRKKGGEQIYDNPGAEAPAEGKRYTLADEDAIVVNVLAPNHMIFFEQEELILFQHFNLEANNLQVVAYVPVGKAHKIYDGMEAEVVVSDELSFKAHVSTKAVRSELIPEYLRSFFNKQNTSLIAVLKIDENQVIPFWSATSGLPVRVRVKNFGAGDAREGEMLYEVGHGLLEAAPAAPGASPADKPAAHPASPADKPAAHPAAPAPAKPAAEKAPGPAKPTPAAKAAQAPAAPAAKPTEKAAAPAAKPAEKAAAPAAKAAEKAAAPCYRIIVAVFQGEKNADKAVGQLRAAGEAGSGKLYRSRQWYVYASAHPTLESAQARLQALRASSRQYREAWIQEDKGEKENR